MKIERLICERYGIFADRTLSFHPEAVLHIVFGANEAGKTSALSAMTDLLFGFGGRTPYDFRHDGKTLRVGGTLCHSDGRTISARRRKGNKNTLVDAADQPLPDNLFEAFLGGVSREVFTAEFGLTAQALREGGYELLNAGGRLSETLAASSAGLTILSRTRGRLQSEADDLFTPRRSSNKPFYLAMDRREAANKTLRDATITREALQQFESAAQEARAHLDELTAEHALSGGTLARWQRTLRVRSKLTRLETLRLELATFTDLPAVPAQSLAEWRVALDNDTALGREMSELDASDAADAAEIEAKTVNEALVSDGSVIDALRERLGATRKAIDDLPRRRQERDAAMAKLTAAARRLGLESHTVLLKRLPTDPALAHARDLIDRAKRLEQVVSDAAMRHARARQELQDLTAGAGEHHGVTDPERLRHRFDALGDIPAQVERLRHDTAALNVETAALAAAMASLNPMPDSPETLQALPLPDAAVISKYAHADELSRGEIKRLSDLIGAEDSAIAATEAELARLSRGGTVPARTDLVSARRERDTHLDGLRAALDADGAARSARFEDVSRSSRTIDGITDLLLTDTERVALYEDSQRRISAARAERDSNAEKLDGLRRLVAESAAAWTQRWAASGLTPQSPAEMLRWRERVDGILNRLDKRDSQKAAVNALAAALDAGKTAVMAFLESVARSPDRSLSPDILFREAKARFDELQSAWADAKARSVAKLRIERDLNEANEARDTAQGALAEIRQAWPVAMDGLGLTGEITPAQAEAALAVWADVAVPKASYEREGRSVDGMEADLQAFDNDVFDVVNRIAPHLKSETAQDTLSRLSVELADMRSASQSRNRLREACAQRAVSRKALGVRRAAAALILDEARRFLGLAQPAALSETMVRIAERRELEGERTRLLRDIQEIGDGRDEAALRQEQAGLDLDQLPGEIARETVRQEQLLKDISDASALAHEKNTELNVVLRGRDAGAAAAECTEANSELLSIAERWLLRSAAARLAARAIERHRAVVQDPLIARASTFFAMATDDAFAGLDVDYGTDDQTVLVARRRNDEKVHVAGLSEGTRDQLFLALRLALLERRTSEPLPFIGDDLLTSFDDARTLSTLRLLAAAGAQRQMILFTHHKHVVDIARSLPDGPVDVIEL